MGTYRRLEDLDVYGKLCQLHIEICELSHQWPPEEKFDLGSHDTFKERYQACIRMLNGLEKALEQYVPEAERRWPASTRERLDTDSFSDSGFPEA